MNRRDAFRLAGAILITGPTRLIDTTTHTGNRPAQRRPVGELPHVVTGAVLTADTLNAIITRVNDLSRGGTR